MAPDQGSLGAAVASVEMNFQLSGLKNSNAASRQLPRNRNDAARPANWRPASWHAMQPFRKVIWVPDENPASHFAGLLALIFIVPIRSDPSALQSAKIRNDHSDDFARSTIIIATQQMPSYLTSRTSRISKPAPLRRESSSPFTTARRTKAFQRTKSLPDSYLDHPDDEAERLDDTGKVLPTVQVDAAKDVISSIEHAKVTMFCELPPRAGMNSTRISEVLNFQKNLPWIVSLAHVHAFISASSKTERQISELLANGDLRKLKLVGRGNDVSGLGEVLILTRDLKAMLEGASVAQEVIADFIDVLRQHPRVTTFSSTLLSTSHIAALTQAGFLVGSSFAKKHGASLGGSSLVAINTISRAHSGTYAAVGGDAAFENLGGVGAAKRPDSQNKLRYSELALSVPNVGVYARLLKSARSHFLELLRKFPYKEAPLYLLRERWDGAVDNEGSVSTAKRTRGEFSEVMPSKTKKWAKLYGLNFDWVLEECLGAGMIELFETRSVGLGIRVTI